MIDRGVIMRLQTAVFPVLAFAALSGFTITRAGDAPKAADRERPSEGASKDAKILERIFANWKSRSERARSVHLKFDYRRTDVPTPVDARRKSDLRQYEVWLEGNDRRATVSYLAFDGGAGQPMRKFRRWTDDGKLCSIVFYKGPDFPDNGVEARGQIIKTGAEQQYWGAELQAIWLAFRPAQPPLSLRPDQFRLVTENAIIGSVHYTKIERTVKERRINRVDSFWVDPARDDLIVHWTMRPAPELGPQHSWYGLINYQKDASQGWIPSQWTLRMPSRWVSKTGSIDLLMECVVIKSTMNEKLPPSTFVPEFPPGSIVIELSAQKRYVLEKNGETRMLSPEEFDRLWSPRATTKK